MGRLGWIGWLSFGLAWGWAGLAWGLDGAESPHSRGGLHWAQSQPLNQGSTPSDPLAPESLENRDALNPNQNPQSREAPLERVTPESGLSPGETRINASAGVSVPLTLADLVELVLTGNRDLQNQVLGRMVQRQELTAAEQTFDPRFTPVLEAQVTRQWSDTEEVVETTTGDILFGTSPTNRDSRAVLQTRVTTRQGTQLEVDADPLNPDRLLTVRLEQPLLRGFGTAVNEAPVEQARLGERRNRLALEANIIDLITTATTRYTSLISAQAQVDIQSQALGRRRRQLEILQALVAAGREAPINLLDTERAVADAERQLVEAQNDLTQANNDILNLIGTDRGLQFIANAATVEALFREAAAQADQYQVETLVSQAFRLRRDYQGAQLERQQTALDLRLAEDALRWQVNAVAGGNLGDLSRTSLGLIATRTFEEPQLETNRLRNAITLQQQDNSLVQQEEEIRNDVAARFADVRSAQLQVEAAERATDSARRQLEATQERYRLGRDDISLSDLIDQEERLVTAETNALEARIAFLNSMAALDQTVGLTLDRWATQVAESPLGQELGYSLPSAGDAQ
jgi:outer membrane protein TolC